MPQHVAVTTRESLGNYVEAYQYRVQPSSSIQSLNRDCLPGAKVHLQTPEIL